MAGWKTFTNRRWGYSLRYPPSWYDLGNAGVDTQSNLSNQSVGAPLAMTSGGVFLSADVDTGARACFDAQVEPGPVDRRVPVVLGGVDTTLDASSPGPGAHEAVWAITTSALISGVCYHLAFITYDRQTRDASLPVAEAIVGSFTLLGG